MRKTRYNTQMVWGDRDIIQKRKGYFTVKSIHSECLDPLPVIFQHLIHSSKLGYVSHTHTHTPTNRKTHTERHDPHKHEVESVRCGVWNQEAFGSRELPRPWERAADHHLDGF